MVMSNRRRTNESAKMFAEAVNIATSRHDGQNHVVTVILSDWSDYLFGHRISRNQWLSATVDNERVLGGKLGVGTQTELFRCVVFAGEQG